MSEGTRDHSLRPAPSKMDGAKPLRVPAKKAPAKRAAARQHKPTILEILDEMGKLEWNYDAMKRV